LVIVQLTIAPKSSYEREHHKHVANHVEDGQETPPSDIPIAPEAVAAEHGDKIVGVMFGKTASQQILSSWWM
jgi:hypothetical protein